MHPRPSLRLPVLVLAITVPLALACGGMSVDPAEHMLPICEEANQLAMGRELVQLDLPAEDVKESALLSVGPERVQVGWNEYREPADAVEGVREELEHARSMASMLGEEDHARVQLAIRPDTPSQRVVDTLMALHGGGLAEVDLLFLSQQAFDFPAYPDPQYGLELEAKLADVAPEMRQMMAAEEISSLIVLCPPMQNAFEAVAAASPDQKCTLITYGMAEGLPMCPATNKDKVITAMQVIMTTNLDFKPTATTLALDPLAEPLSIDATPTWAELGPVLATRDGQTVWFR